MRTSMNSLLCLGGLVLTLSPMLTHAGTITVSVDTGTAGGSGFQHHITSPNSVSIFGTDSGTVTNILTIPHGLISTFGSVFAVVDYGTIKLATGASGSASTITQGEFLDLVTPTAPGVPNGTPGSLTYSISVSGALTAIDGDPQAAADASWDLSAALGGSLLAKTDIHKCGDLTNGAFSNPGYHNCSNRLLPGDLFGVYSATVSFTWGVGMVLDVALSADASALYDRNTNGTVDAGVDMAHSTYWGGVTNVTANGNPVNSFTMTSSSSGVNYANSFVPASSGVPEPATAWLVAAACIVGWLRKRR